MVDYCAFSSEYRWRWIRKLFEILIRDADGILDNVAIQTTIGYRSPQNSDTDGDNLGR